MLRACIVFDQSCDPNAYCDEEVVIAWGDTPPSKNGVLCLSELLAEGLNHYRTTYLEWISRISGSNNEQGLTYALLMPDGFPYWWMTIPTQYSFGFSSIAHDTVRMWALCDWLISRNVKDLKLVGMPEYLVETLQTWCVDRDIRCEDVSTIAQRRVRLNGLKAFAYISLHLVYYGLRRKPTVSNSDLVVVDYLSGYEINANNLCPYNSVYWRDVAELIEGSTGNVRWIHIDMFSTSGRGLNRRFRDIRKLNQLVPVSATHEILQSWLDFRSLWRVVRRLKRIRNFAPKINNINWTHQESRLDLSFIVDEHLRNHFYGLDAARASLYLELFNSAFGEVSSEASCIYLMENQDWELALLRARLRQSGGRNFGYVHTCIRPWDLRYAAQAYMFDFPGLVPTDVLVTNSQDASRLHQVGFPEKRVHHVEPTRFSVLDIVHQFEIPFFQVPNRNSLRLLVLGEYDEVTSDQLLGLAFEALKSVTAITSIEFRPHPTKVSSRRDFKFQFEVQADGTLQQALNRCDAVLCSNMTTAAVQASLTGIIPLVWCADRILDGFALPPGSYVKVKSVHDIEEVLAPTAGIVTRSSYPNPLGFYSTLDFFRWRQFLERMSKSQVPPVPMDHA